MKGNIKNLFKINLNDNLALQRNNLIFARNFTKFYNYSFLRLLKCVISLHLYFYIIVKILTLCIVANCAEQL